MKSLFFMVCVVLIVGCTKQTDVESVMTVKEFTHDLNHAVVVKDQCALLGDEAKKSQNCTNAKQALSWSILKPSLDKCYRVDLKTKASVVDHQCVDEFWNKQK